MERDRRAERQRTAPLHVRIMAITQLAVFEVLNRITGDYEPFLQPGSVAPAGASLDAAVTTAAALGRGIATEVVKNNLRPEHP